jgi:hypothetical protein
MSVCVCIGACLCAAAAAVSVIATTINLSIDENTKAITTGIESIEY